MLDHCLPSKRALGAPNGATGPENKDYAAKSAALTTVTFHRSASEPSKGSKTSKKPIEVLDEDQDMDGEIEVSPLSRISCKIREMKRISGGRPCLGYSLALLLLHRRVSYH